MKRDMDLVRKILISIEECETALGLMNNPEIDGHSGAQISYHISILNDARLLNATSTGSYDNGYDEFYNINLTWEGQDFVDASRNDTVWNKTKAKIKAYGTNIPFEVLLETLKTLAKAEFEQT